MAPSLETERRAIDAQRVIWTLLVLAFLALAVGGPVQIVRAQRSSGDAVPGVYGADARVSLAGQTFSPEILSVAKGAEVAFVNDDTAPHTVTGLPAGVSPVESGVLAPRKVFKLVVRETFEYVCKIHPNMRGKVVVTG